MPILLFLAFLAALAGTIYAGIQKSVALALIGAGITIFLLATALTAIGVH